MLYTKQYLTGRDIDLSKYNLGVIRQIRVDEFMDSYDYDLIDFVRPFYLEESLDLNEEISNNKIHFTYFYLLSREDDKIFNELLKSLIFLYELSNERDEEGNYKDLAMCQVDNKLGLLIKKNDKPIAFIDDSNFNLLGKVMLEMCHFEKPKPQQQPKGDPDKIELMKRRRAEYEKKHGNKNQILFEELVRQVMYIRKITYDEIKDWTIWQLKDVYMVEMLHDASEKSYLLATNSNASVDLKKVKDWKNETKLAR